MAQFVKETTVKAAPREVFAYLADLTRHSEWASHNLEVTQTSTGDIGVGSTFSSVGHQMGTHRDNLAVTEYAEGERFAFESRGDAGVTSHAFDLAAVDGGTRVTKTFELVRPSMMTRFALPMLMIMAPKVLEKDLSTIKSHLDS